MWPLRLPASGIVLLLVVNAAAVPVAVLSEEDHFDTDTIADGGWLFEADGGAYEVADSKLRMTTSDGPFVPYARIYQLGVFGPGGASVEAGVDMTSGGVFVLGFDVSEGAIDLVLTDDSAHLFSTQYGGIIIDSASGDIAWPPGGVTASVDLSPPAGATATVSAGGQVLWQATVTNLWSPTGLEIEVGAMVYSTPFTDDADFSIDAIRFSQLD